MSAPFKVGDRVKYTGTLSAHLKGMLGTVERITAPDNITVRWDNRWCSGVLPESLTLIVSPEDIAHARSLLESNGFTVEPPVFPAWQQRMTLNSHCFLRVEQKQASIATLPLTFDEVKELHAKVLEAEAFNAKWNHT
jgi:hypothetical protein